MPKQIQVDSSIESMRKGDQFSWRNRLWTVEQVNNKNKYSLVQVVESIEAFRIERYKKVQVLRTVPTAKENFDKVSSTVAGKVKFALTRNEEFIELARQNMIKAVNSGHMVGFFDFDPLVRAQVRYAFYEEISNILAHNDALYDGSDKLLLERADDADVIEALRKVVRRYAKQAMRHASRSSNQLSNGISVAEYDEMADLVEAWEFDLEHVQDLARKLEIESAAG